MTNTIELPAPTTTRPALPRDLRCDRAARVRLFRTALGAIGMLIGDADTGLVHHELCEAHRIAGRASHHARTR
ncbi:MAG: hypothetical protein AB7G21_07500 [Dehalococcoidia bacterium]